MVPPSSIWYPLLDTLADSVNPMLAFVAIVTAIFEWRRSSRRVVVAYIVATTLGLAGVYVVRAVDVNLSIWHRLGGHYSTHAAFATSVVISLAFWYPRYRRVLVTVWLAYAGLILIIGYHTLTDVLTASVVACAVTMPWQFASRRTS